MNIKNIKNKVWLTLVTIIFTLTSCVHNKKDALSAQANKAKIQNNIKANAKNSANLKIEQKTQKTVKKVAKEKDVITIWVHGTRLMALQDSIGKNFFYRKVGLHQISEYLDEHKLKKLAKELSDQNTPRFVFNNFCVYGWSGELSHKARKLAAKDLHESIIRLIANYKNKNGVTPKIRLITHSHGGNVALNLVKINNKSQNKITVYELVLLACPVQKKTCNFVSNSMFERVYSLYSQMDMLQIIDPQGLHKSKKKEVKKSKETKNCVGKKPLFSERTFAPEQKITQAKIKINGRGIMHIEFITEKFAKLLPNILQELDQWNAQENGTPEIQRHMAQSPETQMKCLKIGYNSSGKKNIYTRKYLKKRRSKKNKNFTSNIS